MNKEQVDPRQLTREQIQRLSANPMMYGTVAVPYLHRTVLIGKVPSNPPKPQSK